MAELRTDVRALALSVNHDQFPAYYDELLGDFYFAAQPAALVAQPANPPSAAQDAARAQMRNDFAFAREIGTRAAPTEFLERYKDASDDLSYGVALKQLQALDKQLFELSQKLLWQEIKQPKR